MTNRLVWGNCFHIAAFFQFTIMMLAISAILDVIQIVPCFLAKQSKLLSTCHVELLFATRLVALHTSTCCRARSFS